MNLPTLITMFRILAIPFIAIVYYLPFPAAHPVAAILFLLAALTDALDGYLARSLSMVTRFGAFLDPVADKLLVAVALVVVVGNHHISYLVIPAAVILGREIVISGLREWMSEIGKRTSVAVCRVGKFKTMLQMGSLTLLLWCTPEDPGVVQMLGVVLLYLSAILTLWSMCIYLKLAWPDLNAGRQ
ncbi:MAG: CDP-diacylglycerol--glycerol-3-phosphate 3-phosphatidyltransferase [Gammaproteobacteria bacterium]|nr:CDP-diacylglycerol--glycerol-3-phosphate 3-phosphatidyltransferase [Gammaproteobacteria bacterium]MCH9744455.1 CDP-diacylglycerol--glycerol-3-phosphate 3-phosphatidyltransferase [Gammaproteobacteria bacterium]